MNGEHKTGDGAAAPSAAATASPHPEKLLRLPQVMAMTGRGRTATLDDVKAGRFPASIKIGRATCWAESEVQAWITDRIRASRGAAR